MNSKILNENNAKATIANQPATKKIGFFSAILLVIGSSIGAGIFFKNKEILANTQGSIVLSLLSWTIAIFAIMAMALALTEVCSANANNKQGVIGWVREFNSEWMYKAAKNFMAYLYLPINFFVMPMYAILSLNDAFSLDIDWWAIMLIALAIVTWFVIVSGLSSHLANIQNWIITCVKFLPLIFAILIGFIALGINGSAPHGPLPDPNYNDNSYLFFNDLNPAIGVFASIPAIFFAFDGFYAVAGIQGELKEPKKISSILAIGLAIVSFIDVAISLSLLLCSDDGTIMGISLLANNAWILQVVNVLIAFGVLGIVNSFASITPIFYEDLIREKRFPFHEKFQSYMNKHPNKPLVGTIISLVLTYIIIVVLSVIGGLAYLNTNGYDFASSNTNSLYSFCDLMANWTSVIIFGFITIAIFGCLMNRKTKKLKVEKGKFFIPAAIVTIVILSISLTMVFVGSIANIILVAGYNAHPDINISDPPPSIVGSVMQLVVLALFGIIMFYESIWDFIKKRYVQVKNIIIK